MPETPDPDEVARHLSERLYSAYAQQAIGPMHPQHEQVLLSRLVEAVGPVIANHSLGDVVAAANGALAAWEEAEPGIRGPRVQSVDLHASTVRLVPPS